jgi:hypothetical protein
MKKKKEKEISEFDFTENLLKIEDFVHNGEEVWKKRWDNCCTLNTSKRIDFFIQQIGILKVAAPLITEKTLLNILKRQKN